MTGHLLVRGMLVGLLAGILAFGFAKTFGEPQIDKAIAFEDQMAQMHGDAPEEELVSREVQSTFGLFTGVVVYSVSLGGIFALVFAYSLGRIGKVGPRGLAA
ncbi:CbtA family protein, partial [Neorhizobium galegae]